MLNDSYINLIERGNAKILKALECVICNTNCLCEGTTDPIQLTDFAYNVQVNDPPIALAAGSPAYAFTAFNDTDVDIILNVGSNFYMIPMGGSLSVTRVKGKESSLGTTVGAMEYLGTYTQGEVFFNYTY